MSESVSFRARSDAVLGTDAVRAVQNGTDRFAAGRRAAIAELAPIEDMRAAARRIRTHTISHLGHYLAMFADRVEEAGGSVHFAADATEAVAIVAELVRSAGGADPPGGGPIIKSKSMVTEEIDLNRSLHREGWDVVETDLGEFIAQLAGERPTHIIAPVLHKTRQEVGRLFRDHLGVGYTDDPSDLNAIARAHLRPVFLRAEVGITGVNFGVAATGSLVTVTNEGNGWLTATAPAVHIAVMGVERLVPGFDDLAVLLEVLARSATGQRLSVYTNVITGPRRPGEPDGPDRVHVVVVDNGRTGLVGGGYEEALACIRCGACLNVCPVYRQTGGHAYGTVYPGPIGAVISPLLFGLDRFGDLAYASTLCGACLEVCPIAIDLPRMLLELRREAQTGLPRSVVRGVSLFSAAAAGPRRWRAMWNTAAWLGTLAGRRGWISRLPGPGRGWTASRDLRRPRPATVRGPGGHG